MAIKIKDKEHLFVVWATFQHISIKNIRSKETKIRKSGKRKGLLLARNPNVHFIGFVSNQKFYLILFYRNVLFIVLICFLKQSKDSSNEHDFYHKTNPKWKEKKTLKEEKKNIRKRKKRLQIEEERIAKIEDKRINYKKDK